MASFRMVVLTTPDMAVEPAMSPQHVVNCGIPREVKKELTEAVEEICRKHFAQFKVESVY